MDWWLKTGTMKRKLNEKASDTDKEKVQRRDGSASLGIIQPRSCIQTAFFSPAAETARFTYILCCVTLDNDNS